MGCDSYFMERDKDMEAVYTCHTMAMWLAAFCAHARSQGLPCPLKETCPGKTLFPGEDVCAVGLWESEWIRAAELQRK